MQYIKQLEYDKILRLVAEYAVSDGAKQCALDTEPTGDFSFAYEMLEQTDSMYRILLRGNPPAVSNVSGILEIAVRAEKGGTLSMGELLRIKTMLRNARVLLSWHSANGELSASDGLFFRLYEDAVLERSIDGAILSDTEMSDDASPELRNIRKKIARAESDVRDRLDGIIRSDSSKKLLQDALVTMRNGRFVVPVKSENRGALKGLVHDVSQSGSTYFVEPEAVVEANNRIMELKADEAREIERILAAFSAQIGGAASRISESFSAFISIDLLLAKAKYALSLDAFKPILNDTGVICLKKARHPLIAKERAVPIDVSLGKRYNQLAVTGPNTGGKTVTLKTVGLLTLMAMSGLLLPAGEGSEISVFDRVLADIGDEQSIEQSLSTFSGHITNIAKILALADRKSLVLLDELGAGTDPAEGAALAVAILERLKQLESKVVATTHYGEIKLYALQTDGVENASSEFDIKTLKPTYRLLVGVPGMSNALVIAERLGLDPDLIASARGYMDPENRRFEDVLLEIERIRDQITRKEQQAERKILRAEETVRRARKEAKELRLEAEKESGRAQLRSKQMAADVEASAKKLLDEIRRMDREKETAGQRIAARAKEIMRKDSVQLLRDAPEEDRENYDGLPPLKRIVPGESAFIAPIGRIGKILSPPDAGGNVEVQTGPIKTRVHMDGLKSVPEDQSGKRPAPGQTRAKESVLETRTGTNELNLLGMTVDEAILATDRFIDSALLGNVSTVYLIHGKGTGALRAGIQRHLKQLKHVGRFRLGGYGEGDSGVTIVELI